MELKRDFVIGSMSQVPDDPRETTRRKSVVNRDFFVTIVQGELGHFCVIPLSQGRAFLANQSTAMFSIVNSHERQLADMELLSLENESYLAVGGLYDGWLSIYRLSKDYQLYAERIQHLQVNPYGTHRVIWNTSRPYQLFVASLDGTLTLVNWDRVVYSINMNGIINDLSMSPSGNFLTVMSRDGLAYFYHCDSGTPMFCFSPHHFLVDFMQIRCLTDELILTVGRNVQTLYPELKLWDRRTFMCHKQIVLPFKSLPFLFVNPVDQFIFVLPGDGKRIYAYNYELDLLAESESSIESCSTVCMYLTNHLIDQNLFAGILYGTSGKLTEVFHVLLRQDEELVQNESSALLDLSSRIEGMADQFSGAIEDYDTRLADVEEQLERVGTELAEKLDEVCELMEIVYVDIYKRVY